MMDVLEKMAVFSCPECRRPLTVKSPTELCCSSCGRDYGEHDGIWDLGTDASASSANDEGAQRAYYDGSAGADLETGRRRMMTCHMNKAHGIVEAASQLIEAVDLHNVCEVGVGTALHASYFLERVEVARFVGVDISRNVLGRGRSLWEQFPAFIPVVGSAYGLPLAEGSMDLVYFSGALHHCGDPERAIAESARVLRRGGMLVLSEPVWYYPSNLYFNLRIPQEYGQRLLRRGRLKTWCTQAGLRVQELRHFNFVPHVRALRSLTRGVERGLSSIPLIGRFSSMFRCVAVKS
jgi:SAM-dependent methyltransferase